MLHGRRAECDALVRLLADARRSRSGALVVRGEAGVGRSALLGHAARRADGMAVLRASGRTIDRMVLLYEDMKARDPDPRSAWPCSTAWSPRAAGARPANWW